jgi:hypothetical protein
LLSSFPLFSKQIAKLHVTLKLQPKEVITQVASYVQKRSKDNKISPEAIKLGEKKMLTEIIAIYAINVCVEIAPKICIS